MEALVSKKEEYDLRLDTIKAEMFSLLLKDTVTDEDVTVGKKLIDEWQRFSLLKQGVDEAINYKVK